MDRTFIKQRYALIRTAHKLSARKLSFELGQSSEYINQIEAGNSMPSLEGLMNFCDYFHMTLGEFFNEEIKYPVETKKIITELNRLSPLDIEAVYNVLRIIK